MALSKIDIENMVTGETPVANGGTAATTLAGAGLQRPLSKPIIINGNMDIAQRATSKTGLTNGDGGYHTVDRWRWHENGSSSSVWTMTQETLTSGNAYADGFHKALKLDCTTAHSSIGTGDTLAIEHRLEKDDLSAFKKGTANALGFTFGFWVKATKTGTNVVEIQDQTNDRTISGTYTISSSDTWEFKVVSFGPDTTGNFGSGVTLGLIIRFYLYAGTEYTSGGLQSSWGAATTTKRATGQVNLADYTSNNWYITGVQLEVGEFSSTTIPPFQHESFADNFARCARYFFRVAQHGADGLSNQTIGTGYYKNTDQFRVSVYLPVTPRTNPSLISGSASNAYVIDIQGSTDYVDDFTLTRSNAKIIQVMHNNSDASGTIGEAGEIATDNSSGIIDFDAEL